MGGFEEVVDGLDFLIVIVDDADLLGVILDDVELLGNPERL